MPLGSQRKPRPEQHPPTRKPLLAAYRGDVLAEPLLFPVPRHRAGRSGKIFALVVFKTLQAVHFVSALLLFR